MARAALAMRPVAIIAAGVGAALTIAGLVLLHGATQIALLVPSFGASCALVFGVPASPFARPLSVIGGHLVSSTVGLIAMALLGHGIAAMAIGVGGAIAAMMATRTMHPPAGGDPLIIIAVNAAPTFLLAPILLGTLAISVAGFAYRAVIGHPGQK
ncbi:MAG: HPP family protein [Sphingomicrobium sp.]